jgi:hypothetical protein
MRAAKIPLNLVRVASPCRASWDEMSGDDKSRFCGRCAQFVYNFSEMTPEEAEALIMETEGKMCVRFYRRADGTMLTKDCAVGARAGPGLGKLGRAAVAMFLAALSVATFGWLGIRLFVPTMGKPCFERRGAAPALRVPQDEPKIQENVERK